MRGAQDTSGSRRPLLALSGHGLIEQGVKPHTEPLDGPNDLGDYDLFVAIPREINESDIGTADFYVIDPVAVSVDYRCFFDSVPRHLPSLGCVRDHREQPDNRTLYSTFCKHQFDTFETVSTLGTCSCVQKIPGLSEQNCTHPKNSSDLGGGR